MPSTRILRAAVVGPAEVELFPSPDEPAYPDANIFVPVLINETLETLLFHSDAEGFVSLASALDGAEDAPEGRTAEGIEEEYGAVDYTLATHAAYAAYRDKIKR